MVDYTGKLEVGKTYKFKFDDYGSIEYGTVVITKINDEYIYGDFTYLKPNGEVDRINKDGHMPLKYNFGWLILDIPIKKKVNRIERVCYW